MTKAPRGAEKEQESPRHSGVGTDILGLVVLLCLKALLSLKALLCLMLENQKGNPPAAERGGQGGRGGAGWRTVRTLCMALAHPGRT